MTATEGSRSRARALLDVNVLIALLDCDHVSHAAAMAWFRDEARGGWASCPITQNGCLRVMSHPGYPHPLPIQQLAERLSQAAADPSHEFWADDASLLGGGLFDHSRIHGPRSLTDSYLLGLAVRRHGRFVSFDHGIAIEAVRGAKRAHLLLL